MGAMKVKRKVSAGFSRKSREKSALLEPVADPIIRKIERHKHSDTD